MSPSPDTFLARLRHAGPVIWLGVMVGGWATFLVLAIAAPRVLDDLWAWQGTLPFIGQLVLWLLLLPWMLALAVLESDWVGWAKVLVIGLLAAGWTIASIPRRWRAR